MLSMEMRVMALEDVLITKLMAITEHHLRYEGLLAIARALREQVDWAHVRAATAASPFARAFFVLLEGLGIVAPDARSTAGRCVAASRGCASSQSGSAAAGGGVAATHGRRHDRRAGACAGSPSCAPSAARVLSDLLQPRSERVRHAGRARDRGQLRAHRGGAQGRRAPKGSSTTSAGAARRRRARARGAAPAPTWPPNGTHGLAVFACGPAGPARGRAPAAPDRVARGRRRARRASSRSCAAGIGRALVRPARQPQDGADLHRRRPSGLEEVDQVEDDTHGQHDQGGWSQAPLPALRRAGEAQPPRRRARRALRPLQAAPVRPSAGRRARGARRRGRAAAAPVPARARSPASSTSTSRTRAPTTCGRRPPRSSTRTSRRVEREALDRMRAGRRPRRPRRRRRRRRDGGARAGARGDRCCSRTTSTRRSSTRRSRRRSRSPREVLVMRHHDDLSCTAGSAPCCASSPRRQRTRSSRGFGLNSRPTFAHGARRPSRRRR